MSNAPCGLTGKGENAKIKCAKRRAKRMAAGKISACDGCPDAPKGKRTTSSNVRPWQPVMTKGSGNKIPQATSPP